MSTIISNSDANSGILFWNDGIPDLLAGTGIFLIGLAWQFDLVPLGAIAPAVLAPLWKPLRAKITEPRLGSVELAESDKKRIRRFLVTLIVVGTLTFLVGVAVYLMTIRGTFGGLHVEGAKPLAAIPAFILGVMALMTAVFTTINRFVLYCIVFVTSGVTVAVLELDPGFALLAGGLAIVLGGVITLIRFIARHPRERDKDETKECA